MTLAPIRNHAVHASVLTPKLCYCHFHIHICLREWMPLKSIERLKDYKNDNFVIQHQNYVPAPHSQINTCDCIDPDNFRGTFSSSANTENISVRSSSMFYVSSM